MSLASSKKKKRSYLREEEAGFFENIGVKYYRYLAVPN